MLPISTMTLLLSKTKVVIWFKRNKQHNLQYYISFDEQCGPYRRKKNISECLEKITASVLERTKTAATHVQTFNFLLLI